MGPRRSHPPHGNSHRQPASHRLRSEDDINLLEAPTNFNCLTSKLSYHSPHSSYNHDWIDTEVTKVSKGSRLVACRLCNNCSTTVLKVIEKKNFIKKKGHGNTLAYLALILLGLHWQIIQHVQKNCGIFCKSREMHGRRRRRRKQKGILHWVAEVLLLVAEQRMEI